MRIQWLAVRVAALALVLTARSAVAQMPASTMEDFFNPAVLHEIRLTISPRDWAELKANYQLNLYYPCHFQWGNVTVRNVGIRSRGAASRSSEKPGLRVDFDQYELTNRFLGLKSVVLRNNTQDPSNLHERLAMLFFERMGIPAPREAHARLYVNNTYAGLYTIVEAIDKTFLERQFGEDNGYLYGFDYAPDGALYLFDYKGPDPTLYSPQPFRPETHTIDPDPRPLIAMIRAVTETSDADFIRVMGRYLDLSLFMKHAAIENFLGEMDGLVGTYVGMNNFYLYRFEGSTVSRFIPWDKSEAFTGGPEYGIWHYVYDVPGWMRNRLMERAVQFSELRGVYLDTLLACADVASGPDPRTPAAPDSWQAGWLETEIGREYWQVRGAAYSDPVKPFSNEDFEASIQQLLLFARTRPDFVRADVARGPR